jgi:hypothetical protein
MKKKEAITEAFLAPILLKLSVVSGMCPFIAPIETVFF